MISYNIKTIIAAVSNNLLIVWREHPTRSPYAKTIRIGFGTRSPYAKTIRIVYGADPGIYKTIISAVSNNFMIVWMMNTNTPWSGKSMILLVDLDLQKIHLRRFMYTTWKKLIIMIIIIRFGIEPGLNKTIIPTVSNTFMLVWMMNTRSIILEQGGVWVLERFYLLFSFLI